MRRDELTLPLPPATDRPGDRWMCGRSSGQSPCAHGPSAKGICPLADACHPQRTWHGSRKAMALAAATTLVIAVFAVTWMGGTAVVFKPGELSRPHAQILGGTLTSDRCSSCHDQAAISPTAWFMSADTGHADVSQTDRCLDCHHTTIDRPSAKLAHNLPQRARAEMRLASARAQSRRWHDLLPGPAVDQENVECSVCHREHHGADGDLLSVSDSQCQTCHSSRFGSFAESHPQWDRWPYEREREISFDHASHANKHFPATVRGSGVAQFQCADCHARTAGNELARSTSYQRACQSCHDQALRIEVADGIELLALPTLPTESVAKIQPWPELATGFFDGKLSPIAELLMRSERDISTAMRHLPERDYGRINSRDPQAVAAGETVAIAHRTLLRAIASDGQNAIVERALKLGVADSTVSSFVRTLSPQLIRDANQRWFQRAAVLSDEALIRGAKGVVRQTQHQDSSELLLAPAEPQLDLVGEPLLEAGDDLLENDPLSMEPLNLQPLDDNLSASEGTARFDADSMMPGGGWYRDDLRLAIRYRGGGHADPVLKSTVELISQLPPGDSARQRLLQTRAVAACVTCHPAALSSQRGWQSTPRIGRKSELTKFAHGPHLNVSQLADCSHCHAVESQSDGRVNLTSSAFDVHDFAPLGREACAACHTPQAAGDSCIKCHRYHVDLR